MISTRRQNTTIVAEDIAPQVVYLLSDESRLVTGQVVLVDGGVSIRRDGWCQAK